MNKYNYAVLAVVVVSFSFQSCQKTSADPTPIIPPDTVVTFLPSKLTYVSQNPEESVTAAITYSVTDRTIKFEKSYPTRTSTAAYDKSYTYYYSEDGYLLEKEVFDNNGALSTRFFVDRDIAHVIKRLLVENNGTPAKDTFNITYTDSLTAGYRRMRVENISRNVLGSALNAIEDLTFFNDKLVIAVREYRIDAQSELNPLKVFLAYDATDKLIEETSPEIRLAAAYAYETSGTGLDSFYHTLEGRDGYYLTRFNWWPSFYNNDFYFEPLWVALGDGAGNQAVPEMHRFGVLKQVNSDTQNLVFDFTNTVDSKSRITESKIMRNGSVIGTYTVTY